MRRKEEEGNKVNKGRGGHAVEVGRGGQEGDGGKRWARGVEGEQRRGNKGCGKERIK